MQTSFHAFVKARELENSGDLLAFYEMGFVDDTAMSGKRSLYPTGSKDEIKLV